MFSFSLHRGGKAIIEGDSVFLKYPHRSDFSQWSDLRRSSAHFLQPWEPTWPMDDLSRTAFERRLQRYRLEVNAGTGHPFFIIRAADRQLLGGITLGNIRKGVSQSGQIGYWIGAPFAHQGYMSEALSLICTLGFSHFGLHRLEAACIPSNAHSIGLLEKVGFEREGHLRSYLKINGAWQDHILFSRINPLHHQPHFNAGLGTKAQ